MSTSSPKPRWTTVRNRELSLWQSAVEEMLMKHPPDGSAPCRSRTEVLAHPVMIGVNQHVEAHAKQVRVPPPPAGGSTPASNPVLHAYISQLHLEKAKAKQARDSEKLAALDSDCRQYATCDDIGWASCETTYLAYATSTGGTLSYNDWTIQGGGDITYGVIPWTLPNDACVAIIGDWGTGLPDAQALVQELMMLDPAPQAIIHLGDIYYAGTPSQCTSNFVNVLAQAAPGVPVFTIPGNHDYYDWGVGFYGMLSQLNVTTSGPSMQQQASYFCLRTQDGMWQFLGGDTGQGDTDPLDELKPSTGPALRPTEVQWHVDKLTNNFGGSTILLTHHQFFTAADDAINSDDSYPPYLNMSLGNAFGPYFQYISAWFWGHEHNLALFDSGLFGLSMGRIVGSSAYQEAVSDNPYVVQYPQVPFNQAIEFQPDQGYYPHACAVINLQRAQPTDPISVTYYSTPAWYMSPPSPLPGLTPVLTEQIAPAKSVQGATKSGQAHLSFPGCAVKTRGPVPAAT
jgi:hypothetical protein